MSGIHVEHVAGLIKAHNSGDDKIFRDCVDAVIADLVQRGQREEAREYKDALNWNRDLAQTLKRRPADSPLRIPQELSSFMYEVKGSRQLSELVLDGGTRAQAIEFLRDLKAASRLKQHGLKPVRTLLMYGPPGNGKTSLAGALAVAMQVSLIVIRIGGLRSQWMGATSGRIVEAFKTVKGHKCVLFLDEADSVLQQRSSEQSAAVARSEDTNTLLTQMDEASEFTYIFAATNRMGDIDPAARRRFEVTMELKQPGAEALAQYFSGYVQGKLATWTVTLDPLTVGEWAAARGDSFAVLEQRLIRAHRAHVIGLPESEINERLLAHIGPAVEVWRGE